MSRGRSIRRRRLTVVHADPRGQKVTACCGQRLLDLPRTIKVSLNANKVTCGVAYVQAAPPT